MSFNLPQELNELKTTKNWVAYTFVWNEKKGKTDKMPINPHDGTYAKVNDPATWGTYDEAISRAIKNAHSKGCQVGQYDGVGFEFGNAGGYAGIDLDNVVLEDGSLKPFAREIIEAMDSYTEYSPSERGFHILFKLDRPMSDFGNAHRNDDIGLEMYDSGRYFTITGKVYGEAKPVQNRTEQARKIYDKYLLKEAKKNSNMTPLRTSTGNFSGELTDSELLDKMFDSQNGGKIRALFYGNISVFDDDWSRADLALCSYLAYWTNNDSYRMDALFRSSALYRPEKWDKRHYGTGETYGQHTINEAIKTTPTYMRIERNNPPSVDTRGGQAVVPSNDFNPVTKGVNAQTAGENASVLFVERYLEEKLEHDLAYFQKFSKRKTGYYNIDMKTSLYSGLYLIGGVSSLGKTTFAHQMADQLVRAGEHVLFFVLEQKGFEIVTKGISRLTAQENLQTAVSSLEIREGRITDSVRRAIAEYKSFSKHEVVIECNFNTTIKTITGMVEQYIQEVGVKPIVFVDYLQLIRPLDKKMTVKDAVDEHVRAFKLLQMDNDLVIFLISSLNRQNYLTMIDFEAFKETGGLEYTCDVMWGLQLYVMNDEIFDTDKKLKSKRELVREAKRENPRKIELCVLKNRYGIANGSYHFDYYAKYDLFIPVETREKIGNDLSDSSKARKARI